jgi:Sigma-70 factor, region 1.2
MRDPVGQYLDEIGVMSLLTADEERQLSQAIEQGREAQARLDAGEHGRQLDGRWQTEASPGTALSAPTSGSW